MSYYISCLKNYVQFKGRARRAEFWYFTLCNVIVSMFVGIVAVLIHFPQLRTIYALVMICPALGVSFRRVHDHDMNGWFSFIPFYNLYLFCTKGTAGPNRFGPDPLVAVSPASEDVISDTLPPPSTN